jgi:hypothetical protein
MILEAILFASLFHHKKKPVVPPTPVKPVISQASLDGVDKVMNITRMMGNYIAESNAQMRFEQDKIDAVEADVMECYQGQSAKDEAGFLKDVEKLEQDWEDLTSYDHLVTVNELI